MRARTETTAHLDAEIDSVDIIPQEEIVVTSKVAPDVENLHEIVLNIGEESMYIQ